MMAETSSEWDLTEEELAAEGVVPRWFAMFALRIAGESLKRHAVEAEARGYERGFAAGMKVKARNGRG